MSLKILHVLESLAPRRGGPVSVLLALGSAQASAGHTVTIATTNSDYPSGILRPAGIDTLQDGALTIHFFTTQFRSLDVSVGLGRFLAQSLGSFDIVHIHGMYRFPSTYCAWLARKQSIPYIIRPHGALDPYLYARSSANIVLKRLYERWFDLPNLHGASAIHYTAEDERRLAAFLNLRAPFFVVPNGLDWEPFERLPPRGGFRACMSLDDAPLVLFLGRLHHKKGLDILVPAFDQVRNVLPQARLAIVGPANDDYGDQVRAWVRERGLEQAVTFVEFLSGVELIQAYVDADVFVLPSYTENFGMTVVESMACALPVIISRHVNIHQEVTAAGTGLVTECDPDEVARAILELLNDPERRQRLGENGRRAAQSCYTWPRIVDLLSEEYRRVIELH
jgi:glycosyltransferase involved in cell wall biosynthesis